MNQHCEIQNAERQKVENCDQNVQRVFLEFRLDCKRVREFDRWEKRFKV